MRKSHLLAVLSLLLLIPASITRAQTISSKKGLTTAIFPTQYGNVKIYLPDVIMRGDVISGTVVAEPKGNNARQLEKNLAELMKFSVSVDGNKYEVPAKEEAFKWIVEKDRQLTAPMELLHVSGYKAHELTLQFKTPVNNQPMQQGCVIPSHALTGSPLRITGPFDGNSSNTNCTIGNKPMEILAESPGQCIVSYPADAGGLHTLNVQENNQSKCSQQVSGVQMNVSAGKLNLLKGQNTYINVSITGLQNLPDTALLTLKNITTGIVTMQPSNNVAIPLPPGTVSSGTFNSRFDIHSIITGTFTVNVNLDLPDNLYDDHPPTQPQPPDNPQPKDTTVPQPPHGDSTVAQCSECKCSCSIDILLKSKKGNETTYSVTIITAACTGEFGYPPCTPCARIGPFIYEWTVTSSADKPVTIVGSRTGSEVTINNPDNGSFTLSVIVTVTCSKGSCTCKAVTRYLATNPVGECPGCQCECSATIMPVVIEGDEWEYTVDVKKVCYSEYSLTGTPPCTKCTDIKTTYLWSIGDDKVAKITGSNTGQTVKLRIIKPGKFLLHVDVTVTCSDKKTCVCKDDEEGVVPDKKCVFDWSESKDPKMDGGLKESSVPASGKIKRDDYIVLSAEGSDWDQLTWTCTPTEACKEAPTVKTIPLNSRVTFKWTIIEGEGNFVKLGCLPLAVSLYGDKVIFSPPVVPLPVLASTDDTTLTTKIKLSIIDDNPTPTLIDPEVDDTITIRTTRSKIKPEEYSVVIIDEKKHKLPVKPPKTDPGEGCKATSEWAKKEKLKTPEIDLPAFVGVNNKMVLGQWIFLRTDVLDMDNLKIYCVPSNAKECPTSPGINKNYEDSVQFTWSITNEKFPKAPGEFILGNTGNTIIYQAPLEMPAGAKMLTVKIKVKASNPNADKIKDDDSEEGEITLEIFQPGVKLSYPPITWLPDTVQTNFAELKSELMYRDVNDVWQPGFAHMSRIHFFELMEVSNEKGVCMNAPLPDNAKLCRDLKLKKEKGQEVFLDTSGLTDCKDKGYFMQARTEAPVNSCTIKIYSEDYGAWGFLRSFANVNKGGKENIIGEKPVYISIPWTDKTVEHLHKLGKRSKKREYIETSKSKKTGYFSDYSDNRVTIPYDIDENHIADNGWPTSDGKSMIPDPVFNNVDEDNKPAGDKTDGDGLSTYEEYRGFMVQQTKKEKKGTEETTIIETNHVRTDPKTKTIFIRNENDLPIYLYKTITNLEVFELKEARYYQSDDERVVNFNSPPVAKAAKGKDVTPSTHLVDQKGLWLKKSAPHGMLHGEGFSMFFKDEKSSEYDKQRPVPPNWEQEIRIYVETIEDFCNKLVAKAKESALKNAKESRDRAAIEKNPAKKQALLDEAVMWENEAKLDPKTFIAEKIAATVAHELLHGNNVCHHGEVDPKSPKSYDNPGGLRSGNVSCVMRYDNLGTNITNGKLEAIGSSLCTDAAGTGYNANGNNYGNATNGNCAGQIRITGIGWPNAPPACPSKK